MKAKLAAVKGQHTLGDEGETSDTLDTLLIQMSDYIQLLTESADEAKKEIGEILTGLIGKAQSLNVTAVSPTSEVKQGDAGSETTSVPEKQRLLMKKTLIETLKKQLEELTEKLKALDEENARLKAEKELAEAEAKSTFGDVAIDHGRTAQQIKENLIIAKGLVTQLEARKLGDSAIKGKYDYLINRQREQNKPRLNLGDRKTHQIRITTPRRSLMAFRFKNWDSEKGTLRAGTIYRASSSNDKVWGEEKNTTTGLPYGVFVAVNPDGVVLSRFPLPPMLSTVSY